MKLQMNSCTQNYLQQNQMGLNDLGVYKYDVFVHLFGGNVEKICKRKDKNCGTQCIP